MRSYKSMRWLHGCINSTMTAVMDTFTTPEAQEQENSSLHSLDTECASSLSCTLTLVKKLLLELSNQSELVIDFSSLKTCLNPSGIENTPQEQKELDYEELVCELIEKQSEQLPQLKKLTVRRLCSSKTLKNDEQHDRYAQINHGIMHMSCLTELDLCEIPAVFHDQIQLWNVNNLKKLSITNSKLKSFPGSVGRLSKLEVLDLSNNELSSLPITIGFCKNLQTLDLFNNNFRQLPGVLLQLDKLSTLRRLKNPLTPQYECSGPHYTRKLNRSETNGKKVYEPISLQASCTTTIFTSQIDYWETDAIGPLQCKTLDRLAAQFTVCDYCKRMLPKQATTLQVEVLLVTFAELSGVPFLLNACSEMCQSKLVDMYGERNVALQKQLDTQYEETIRKAQEDENMHSSSAPPTPHATHSSSSRRRKRKKRCSIM